MVSLPPACASARRFLALNRQQWTIENKRHDGRDVTLHEATCALRHGHAAQTIALLNNLAPDLLRVRRVSTIVSLPRRFSACSLEDLALVLYAPS